MLESKVYFLFLPQMRVKIQFGTLKRWFLIKSNTSIFELANSLLVAFATGPQDSKALLCLEIDGFQLPSDGWTDDFVKEADVIVYI